MKIDATTSIYAAQRYRMIANNTVVQTPKNQGKDDIDISGEAVSFSKVFNIAKMELEKMEDRGMRVRAISEEVASGSFPLEPEKIADSILTYI